MDTVTKKIPTLLAHLNESIETHDLATESQTSSNMSWKEIGVCVTKIENPNELSEAKMTETTISKDAPAVNQPNRGHRKIITPKKPVAKPGSRSSDYFSGVKAESPLVLTPTQVLSAASTPSSSSGIWDSPETPLHAASNESRTEILTPFTPLTPETTNKPSAAETPAPLVRKLFLGTDANGPTIFDQIESRVPGASPHNDPEETSSWEDEDDLESMPKPKLFRGLTDQMNDSKLSIFSMTIRSNRDTVSSIKACLTVSKWIQTNP